MCFENVTCAFSMPDLFTLSCTLSFLILVSLSFLSLYVVFSDVFSHVISSRIKQFHYSNQFQHQQMKHPFQVIITNQAGTHLFTSVKNRLQVFDLTSGNVVGNWIDTVNISDTSKKQFYKKKKNEENKKIKDNAGNAIPVTSEDKISIPSSNSSPIPGVTPIFNYIRSLTLSANEQYLICTTDSDKAVIIFEIKFSSSNCLELMKRQVFPKRPCSISIDDSDIVVADKFGDVYSIKIDSEPPVSEKSLVPILGHVSMLSEDLVVPFNNKKFILTSDRDEHIKVSNYPKSYVVKNWLFGHREYVSELHIPQSNPELLISGGGDDFLCLWKWYENKEICKIQLRDLIKPYLNDSHLPSERFMTESSIMEISVSKLLTYKSNDKLILIVSCEQTNCILTFEISENYAVKHLQTFEVSSPLVDICLDSHSGVLVGSLDVDGDNLLQFYKFDENYMLKVDDSKQELSGNLTKLNPCDVDSRDEFYPLYYKNTLRKRSEH